MHDLVNGKGIARMFGVTPSTVANWEARYPNFPPPLDIPGVVGIPLWERLTILEWHLNNRA